MGAPCGTSPAYGLPDPLSYADNYCDAQAACVRGLLTPSEYAACIASAAAAQTTCLASCSGPGDDSEIVSTFSDCKTACTATNEDCRTACEISGGDDDCYLACANALFPCMASCYTAYETGLAALPLTEDFACEAACCSGDSDNAEVCGAPCQTAYTSAISAATSGFWTCTEPCVNGWDGTELLYDNDCYSACAAAQTTANSSALAAYLECQFVCASDDCPACFSYPSAINATTQACNQRKACVKAYFTIYIAAVAACAGDPTCIQTATNARDTAALHCCWNVLGKSLYEGALNDCIDTWQLCQVSADIACVAPGTTPADPCFDEFSDECVAATATYTACLAAFSCDTDKASCIGAISFTDGPRGCAGCLDPS